jgi:hypothetical protein
MESYMAEIDGVVQKCRGIFQVGLMEFAAAHGSQIIRVNDL